MSLRLPKAGAHRPVIALAANAYSGLFRVLAMSGTALLVFTIILSLSIGIGINPLLFAIIGLLFVTPVLVIWTRTIPVRHRDDYGPEVYQILERYLLIKDPFLRDLADPIYQAWRNNMQAQQIYFDPRRSIAVKKQEDALNILVHKQSQIAADRQIAALPGGGINPATDDLERVQLFLAEHDRLRAQKDGA